MLRSGRDKTRRGGRDTPLKTRPRNDAQAGPRQTAEVRAIPHRLLAGRVQIGPDARGRKHRAVDLRDGWAGREVLHGVARRPFPGFDDRDACLHPHVRLDRRAADLPIACGPNTWLFHRFRAAKANLSFSRGIGPTLRGVAVAHGEVGPRLKDWHEDGRPDADLLRVDVPPVDVWRTARHVPLHTPTLAPSRGAGSQQQAAAAATAAAE